MYTIKDLYDLNETIAAKLFEGKTYPWEVLADIGDFIMKLGPTLPKDEFNQIEDNIWVHKTVKIAPTASLTGPLIVDADTEIRPSAFVRGKAIVGKNCVVGNSTELKNVVLFNTVQVPHYNYVGDSILGTHSHMGAGSITSNVKSDKTLVVVKNGDEQIETEILKLCENLYTQYFFEFRTKLEQEKKDIIITKNTVAILFPYLRSQVTLMTAQPDIEPVVIPAININALLKNMEP